MNSVSIQHFRMLLNWIHILVVFDLFATHYLHYLCSATLFCYEMSSSCWPIKWKTTLACTLFNVQPHSALSKCIYSGCCTYFSFRANFHMHFDALFIFHSTTVHNATERMLQTPAQQLTNTHALCKWRHWSWRLKMRNRSSSSSRAAGERGREQGNGKWKGESVHRKCRAVC